MIERSARVTVLRQAVVAASRTGDDNAYREAVCKYRAATHPQSDPRASVRRTLDSTLLALIEQHPHATTSVLGSLYGLNSAHRYRVRSALNRLERKRLIVGRVDREVSGDTSLRGHALRWSIARPQLKTGVSTC
jgi:hypothetical protein